MASSLCFLTCHFSPFFPKRVWVRKKTERLQEISAIKSSLRDKGLVKKPMWRTAQDMSSEAIQASRVLKLASSDLQNRESRLEYVFESKISRLLRSDLVSLLAHFQRLDNCDLAVRIFEFARKESWYKPDLRLYSEMIYMLARNSLVDKAEHYFIQLREEGLTPDTRVFTEILGAYLEVGMVDKAMETYESMKSSGCRPDQLTFTVVLRNLERFGETELANSVKEDVAEYIEDWEMFLRNVERKGREISPL